MYKLDQKQLEYLARTIMSELYERQKKHDEFFHHLESTLPAYTADMVKDSGILQYNAHSAAGSK